MTSFAEQTANIIYDRIKPELDAQIKKAVLAEREACAQLCETVQNAEYCANSIRERGK